MIRNRTAQIIYQTAYQFTKNSHKLLALSLDEC